MKEYEFYYPNDVKVSINFPEDIVKDLPEEIIKGIVGMNYTLISLQLVITLAGGAIGANLVYSKIREFIKALNKMVGYEPTDEKNEA